MQSAGRNQAVLIHTATGQHLDELKALFADVGFAASESELFEPIENLRNLGTTSAVWLREAGIGTIAELARLGPIVAFRLVKQRQPRASLNLLWAFAAGIQDRDWRDLTPDEKKHWQDELEAE